MIKTIFKFINNRKKHFLRKQKNIELLGQIKKYWHKIIKYFLLVFLLGNGLCLLLRWWSFMFFYFYALASFSAIFILFMLFYTPELNIKDCDY